MQNLQKDVVLRFKAFRSGLNNMYFYNLLKHNLKYNKSSLYPTNNQIVEI